MTGIMARRDATRLMSQVIVTVTLSCHCLVSHLPFSLDHYLCIIITSTMEDPELAAIRASSMNQLKQQAAPGQSASGGGEDDKRAAEEQMRRDLLATVLDSAARERCMS